MKSDLVNGEIRGIYSFSGIVPSVNRLLNNYLPTLFDAPKSQKTEKPNNFSINLSIEDTQKLSQILDLPFILFNKTRLVGQYNSIYDKFRLELYSPRMGYGKNLIESGTILAENSGNSIKVDINGISLQKNNKKLPFSVSFNAANDNVDTQLKWDSNIKNMYLGELGFSTHFSKKDQKSPLKTNITLHQTNAIFNDAKWIIHPATIEIDSGRIAVNRLKIDHDDQYLQLEGIISNHPDDNLRVDLNKIDLEYVFTTLNIPALQFGGLASGHVNAQDVFKTRKLSTSLDVTDLSFNSTLFGDLTDRKSTRLNSSH